MTLQSNLISVRLLKSSDLAAALAIQSETYPPFLREDEDAFASRLNLTTSYCLAATYEGTLVAYLLAYGWPAQTPAPIDAVVVSPPKSEVLFIHDLAVSSTGRGSGVGQKLIARAFELAAHDGLLNAELIAVEGASTYWRKLGFVESETSIELARKVASYGPEACCMAREIPVAPTR